MKEIKFLSPVKGEVYKLKEFPDEIISDGTMGEGFTVLLEDDLIVSPFKGEVTVVYPTGHALCIVSEEGIQMMVHIGADTYKITDLNKTYVKVGDKVNVGDKLVKTNVRKLKKRTGSTAVAIVFLNNEKVNGLKENQDIDHLEEVCGLSI